MKKVIAGMLFLVFVPLAVQADTIHLDLGSLRLDLPFQTVSGVALWDFVHKQGDAGVVTRFGEWKNFTFNFGAVTSVTGRGAPILNADYVVKNPVENFVPLAELSPGVFGGYDFSAPRDTNGKKRPWILGVKLSAAIW